MNDERQILLVGAASDGLLYADSVLKRQAGRIASAPTAEHALEILRTPPPSLAIFGFQLGNMTAPEFCRRVREDGQTRSTALLFVGERGAEREVDLCMAAGCNDIVLRPLRPHELDAKVERLLSIPVRRRLRTLTRAEVSIERGGNFMLGHSLNISATGMLLELDHILAAAIRLRLQFYLHGEVMPVRVIATVMRADFSGAFPTYGCRFEHVDNETVVRINRYVERVKSREAL